MLKRLAPSLLLLCLGLMPLTAHAALERSRLDVLGFSADGRFFAYRQSGVEEKGSAYADLFIVDTTDGSWVQDTPIRVRSMDGQNVSKARSLLQQKSARLMRRLGLAHPIAGVAFVPKDRTQMWVDMPSGEHVRLQLWSKEGLAAPGCPVSLPVAKGSLRGFKLTMERPSETALLYADRVIPRSRGCAISYRFASGFIKPRGDDTVVASVIAYREQTGKDTSRIRYTAITNVIKTDGAAD